VSNVVRGLSIALWFSLLFLPFSGFRNVLILFAALFSCAVIISSVKRYWNPLKEKFQSVRRAVKSGVRTVRFKPLILCSTTLILLFFPLLAGDYVLDVAILTGIYAILALGLNVMVGFAGLLNLGYAAFYAIGAYAYALLNVKAGFGFWQSLPCCLILTTAAGCILAVPALRLKGDYLAIVTLGFGEIVRLVLNNWDSLTGGPNGITGIDPPYLLGTSMAALNRYYYVTLGAVTVTYIIISRIRMSRIGRAWVAIREDDIGASSMGISTTWYKLYAFAFGSLWAGLAGALFAAKMRFISPESFTFMESVVILSMVILGGLGSSEGAILGALILVMLPELLREVQLYRMLALGAGLILIMIFRPQGFIGGFRGGR
jgi:branched-chain amino acid transport system permease protein